MKLFNRKLKWTGNRHNYSKDHRMWGHDISFKLTGKTYKGSGWSPRKISVGDRINVGASDFDLIVTEIRWANDPHDMFFFTAKTYPIKEGEPAETYTGGSWF